MAAIGRADMSDGRLENAGLILGDILIVLAVSLLLISSRPRYKDGLACGPAGRNGRGSVLTDWESSSPSFDPKWGNLARAVARGDFIGVLVLALATGPNRKALASDKCESCIEGVREPSCNLPGTGVLVASSSGGESDPEEELEDDALRLWLLEDRRSAMVTACCGTLGFCNDPSLSRFSLEVFASSDGSTSTGVLLRISAVGGALSNAESLGSPVMLTERGTIAPTRPSTFGTGCSCCLWKSCLTRSQRRWW